MGVELVLVFACIESIKFFFPVERSSSPGSLLLGHAQGGFLDMVDFHTFLQDVLETGGIDMGMYLFDFSLRVLKMGVVSNVQRCN